jgi:putative redox protein
MAALATVTWKEGIHFVGTSAGHTVDMDGNTDAGGQDLGFAPMRLLLVAFGGCTGMDVISILKKMRQDVTHFEMELNGTRATEHPKVYTQIEIVYRLRGRNLARDMVEKAVQLSEDKYCSVGAMLKKAAPIVTRIEVEEEP